MTWNKKRFSAFYENLPFEDQKILPEEVIREIYLNASSSKKAAENCAEYAETIRAEKAAEEKKENVKMTIERKKEIRNNRAALIEAHKNSNNPNDAVNALIASIGYDAAVEIVAIMISVKGIWDQRISIKNRAWAAEIAANSLGNDFVFYCDEIHPAHMEQIATAMRETERPNETPENKENPETARGSDRGRKGT